MSLFFRTFAASNDRKATPSLLTSLASSSNGSGECHPHTHQQHKEPAVIENVLQRRPARRLNSLTKNDQNPGDDAHQANADEIDRASPPRQWCHFLERHDSN